MKIVDFILEYAYLLLYAITVLVALWRYPRYFDTVFKYLPILLMYTFLTEVLGNIIKNSDEYDFILSDLLEYNNWLIYNIYDIVFFLYFFFLFWLSMGVIRYRRIIVIGIILFLLAIPVNLLLADFRTQFQMITYFTGAFVIVAIIMVYFTHLKSTIGKWFMGSNLLSWLSIGILIFILGYIPIIILGHFNIVEGQDYHIIRRIHLILILVMYSCFIAGFVKVRRKSIN